jgi:regulatory protein
VASNLSSLKSVARLTIEHDSVDDDVTARTRRRSIALRLDGRAWLRVEPEALGELEVAEGDEIDDARRAAVEHALARVRARLFIVRSLAVRMQSAAEIERKLAARDVPPEVAQEAIERVTGYGYIDDESLAEQLARGMQARGYGRRRAAQKLRTRGLSGSLAEAALGEAYGGRDEVALAREALGRRPVANDADRRRAIAFLARRGFSAGAAWKAVREAAEDPPAGAV